MGFGICGIRFRNIYKNKIKYFTSYSLSYVCVLHMSFSQLCYFKCLDVFSESVAKLLKSAHTCKKKCVNAGILFKDRNKYSCIFGVQI